MVIIIIITILSGMVGFIYALASPMMALFTYMLLYEAGLKNYQGICEAYLLGAIIGSAIHEGTILDAIESIKRKIEDHE